ncbi:serine/threonine protein kinase [Pendulispora albinea]|uniref:Protein kinase n=1 Tax=Pendulispora albinea TaxID=2741071 RepID=A0ABZ2M668_9BACT
MQGESVPKRGVPQPIRGGPIKFGRYLLEARIAVGGTAEVYLARPLPPEDEAGTKDAGVVHVAATEAPRLIIKRLLPHFLIDPEGRTMFEREAALHTAVHHENVVQVYGSGLSDTGEPYLAMEYVDGVDAYRLLRRFRNEGRALPNHVAVHIISKVLAALESVHSATDDQGTPLGIIHRDVTPSNLYLSKDGRVKLGDFGIARSTQRATMRNAASAMLKGKIAYLAPEQVAGEPFDYRADLFSVATVLTEMVIGKPLFPGGGQLAILLAIRDCRIDPLREAKERLPKVLFDSLICALSRDPKARFQSAAQFASSIKDLDPTPDVTAKQLGTYVTRAQTGSELAASSDGGGPRSSRTIGTPPPLPATRKRTPPPLPTPFNSDDAGAHPRVIPEARASEPDADGEPKIDSSQISDVLASLGEGPVSLAEAPSSGRVSESQLKTGAGDDLDEHALHASLAGHADPADHAGRVSHADPVGHADRTGDAHNANEATTAQYAPLPSLVITVNGERHGPWAFARLVEAIATGELGARDQVSYMGRGLQHIEDVDDLVRFLPAKTTTTTNRMRGPGAPDFHDDLHSTNMLDVLLRILETQDTGVLFADGASFGKAASSRKELYFKNGKLLHVSSTNASELFGEYLVRRGALRREQLEVALNVLPRYGGRMGDTLIALGLVGPVEIFRAIREQGRDRVADIFRWQYGTVSFYRGQTPPHVEFPLDVELPDLMIAGLEASWPDDSPLERYESRFDDVLTRTEPTRRALAKGVKWPPLVGGVLTLCAAPEGVTVRDLLQKTCGGVLGSGDVLRAVEILLAAGFVGWKV